jgi:hypothetical protein
MGDTIQPMLVGEDECKSLWYIWQGLGEYYIYEIAEKSLQQQIM